MDVDGLSVDHCSAQRTTTVFIDLTLLPPVNCGDRSSRGYRPKTYNRQSTARQIAASDCILAMAFCGVLTTLARNVAAQAADIVYAARRAITPRIWLVAVLLHQRLRPSSWNSHARFRSRSARLGRRRSPAAARDLRQGEEAHSARRAFSAPVEFSLLAKGNDLELCGRWRRYQTSEIVLGRVRRE